MKKQLIGLGVAALMLIGVACANANLITNSSFETDEVTWDGTHFSMPNGDWHGDRTDIVVGNENGITPQDAGKMLRFDSTGPSAAVGGAGTGSELWQWIDISAFATEIASGFAVADLSAYFNRVAGNGDTDTGFAVSIYAYETFIPADWAGSAIEYSEQHIVTDALLGTWELAQTQMFLPTDTNLLLVRIGAFENIFNDVGSQEFDGHYADNVALTITTNPVPEPTTMALFCAGFAGLVVSRVRRKK